MGYFGYPFEFGEYYVSIPVPPKPVEPKVYPCWVYATHHLYPHCCGIVEVGTMTEYSIKPSERPTTPWHFGDTWEEAWKKVINNISEATRKYNFDSAKYRPLVFNFKRERGNEYYDAWHLRDLIEAQTFGEAFRVYQWINPNTGNELDQWLLKNDSQEVK